MCRLQVSLSLSLSLSLCLSLSLSLPPSLPELSLAPPGYRPDPNKPADRGALGPAPGDTGCNPKGAESFAPGAPPQTAWLFRTREDPSERCDLSLSQPAMLSLLRRRLEELQATAVPCRSALPLFCVCACACECARVCVCLCVCVCVCVAGAAAVYSAVQGAVLVPARSQSRGVSHLRAVGPYIL